MLRSNKSCIDGDIATAAGAGVLTVSRAVASELPPGPLATMRYVVDSLGLTVLEPLASTLPIDSSVTWVAFCASHVRFADCPWLMSAGSTLSVTVGCGWGGGGAWTFAVTGFLAQPATSNSAAASMTTNVSNDTRDFIDLLEWSIGPASG